MPVLIIGGEGEPSKEQGFKPKRSISKIGGEEEEPKEPEEETGSEMDPEEQKLSASEQILSAIQGRNAKRLNTALEAFVTACQQGDD